MPARSSGCLNCRKRKIRCDEARPGCERCAVHGVQCPGYSTAKRGSLEFRDQTTTTVKRAERQYEAKKLNSKSVEKRNGSMGLIFDEVTGESSPSSSSSSGDDGSSEYSNNDWRDDSYKPTRSLVLASHSNAITPTFMRSPNAERVQIYGAFISTYLPKVADGASQDGHFLFYQSLALRPSSQPALERGMDALSLVQVGSLHQDQLLLKEAVRQYGIALRHLASSISRKDFLYDDDILAAVACLASCELYEEIANAGRGWIDHVSGLNQLMAARGPESFRSDLSLLLYASQTHGSLVYALISRRAPFMASLEWRTVAFRASSAPDATMKFYDVAIQVPGLLERHDALDSNSQVERIDKLLEDSKRLETLLRNWHADWQAGDSFDNSVDCKLTPIASFLTFSSVVQGHLTFDHAYSFSHFFVGYLYSLYWMVMFHLRSNTQSLHRLRSAIVDDWYPDSDTEVPEPELLSYALSLCKCIPFFTEPISGSAGYIAIFLPMRTAALYFREKGHWRWLKWIGEVKNNVFVKGLAPPPLQGDGKSP